VSQGAHATDRSRDLPVVWIKRFGQIADIELSVATELAAADVRLITVTGTHAPLDGTVGGIVLFTEASTEILEFVRRSTADRRCRVLAIAVGSLQCRFTWELLAAGAYDVLTWKRMTEPTSVIVGHIQRWIDIERLLESSLIQDNLIGRSQVWTAAIRQVAEMAHFSSSSVLLMGESGTGKELLAKVVHHLTTRSQSGPFVVLDCTTLVPELSGSEFFGHERGAFTNAVSSREGAFAAANGGTLFLDEVGELPLILQAALLRVVQERTYKPVGSNTWKRSDFRLVCATHRDLRAEESCGSFRRDFYFRIAGSPVHVPPLSERREDIPLLVDHFLRSFCAAHEVPTLDPLVRDYLQVRDYPGNIRELQHLVARMAGRYVGRGPITVGHLPEDERLRMHDIVDSDWRHHLKTAVRHAMLRGLTLREISGAASETAIETAICEEDGNLQRAARRLGVTGRALQLRRAASREARAGGHGETDELAGSSGHTG